MEAFSKAEFPFLTNRRCLQVQPQDAGENSSTEKMGAISLMHPWEVAATQMLTP